MYCTYSILPSFPLFHRFWDSPWPWTTHSSLPETWRHLPLFWEIQPVAFIALGWYIAPEAVPGPQRSIHWPSYINFNQEDTASFREGESCSYFPLQNLDEVEKKVKTTLTTKRKATPPPHPPSQVLLTRLWFIGFIPEAQISTDIFMTRYVYTLSNLNLVSWSHC